MRNQIRTLISAWRAAPYTQLRAADHRNWSYDRLAKEVGIAAGYTVMHGPYEGMKYFDSSGIPIVDRQPTMKLVGSFEEELHPWIESLTTLGYRQIIHLGAGEGYHAVGLALRMPDTHTIVFDTLLAARKACWFLAQQNGVSSRMQVRGFCDGEALNFLDMAGSLVFSDCGGAELVLLDPKLYPSLRLATILVETHDSFDFRITPQLLGRFRPTHRIETVTVSQRDPNRYPFVQRFPSATTGMILDETRSVTTAGKPQAWFLMTPLSS